MVTETGLTERGFRVTRMNTYSTVHYFLCLYVDFFANHMTIDFLQDMCLFVF